MIIDKEGGMLRVKFEKKHLTVEEERHLAEFIDSFLELNNQTGLCPKKIEAKKEYPAPKK